MRGSIGVKVVEEDKDIISVAVEVKLVLIIVIAEMLMLDSTGSEKVKNITPVPMFKVKLVTKGPTISG